MPLTDDDLDVMHAVPIPLLPVQNAIRLPKSLQVQSMVLINTPAHVRKYHTESNPGYVLDNGNGDVFNPFLNGVQPPGVGHIHGDFYLHLEWRPLHAAKVFIALPTTQFDDLPVFDWNSISGFVDWELSVMSYGVDLTDNVSISIDLHRKGELDVDMNAMTILKFIDTEQPTTKTQLVADIVQQPLSCSPALLNVCCLQSESE